MSVDFSFEIFIKTRKAILSIIDSMDLKTLNKIPTGFNNNIAWNFGHVIVTPQMLCYKRAGVDCTLTEEMIEKYRKGSKPENDISQAELDMLKSHLFESIEQLKADYTAKKFQTYDTVVTSLGVTLDTIEKAIQYSAAHDNLHFGYIQALKRAVNQL